jgi:hypothetical protein
LERAGCRERSRVDSEGERACRRERVSSDFERRFERGCGVC